MSDEPSTTNDLSAIDLSLSFAPAWAKESDSGERLAKLAAKHDRPERPERGGKSGFGRDDRGPRSDRRPPPRREGGDRPPRKDGKRDSRSFERRPERDVRPEPTLRGWNVQFLSDRHGVEGLAKQIKASAKAYPLFDLARLVLEKSERYLVEFKRTSDDATAVFQLKADGSLWLSEGEAVAHALAAQLDRYYRRERVTIDPPKGNYAFVAVCGLSGVLLGPPNFHDYQTKLIKLHAARFASMPFEAFKSRIRMVRDEESIAKWKEEQSSKDVFYPRDPSDNSKPEEPTASEPAAENSVAEAPEPPTVEVAAEAAEPAPEQISEDAALAADAVSEPPAAETPVENTEAAPEPAEEAPTPENMTLRLESLADVERHFREHHLAKAVVQIRERVVAPGPAAMNESAPAVLRLARGAWEQLNAFPLPLAHHLGQQLTARNLQIFKTHDNITYVGVARPHFLDVVATPVSAVLSEMLAYIEAHPSVPRAEQWKALVELRPLAAEGAESARETAVAADLFWLLREGHVIDYAKRGLQAARRPKPPTPKKNSPKKSPAPGLVADQPESSPEALIEAAPVEAEVVISEAEVPAESETSSDI